jgi:uncharacterized protein YdeI (YjbR/CyaY-like superfamily)
MRKFEEVEAYYKQEYQFKEGIYILRQLIKKTKLVETYKWSFPTYTLNNKNVLAICRFNTHFGIWFFNGVLLKDVNNVLENAQEGKTMAMRHWKFNSLEEIDINLLLSYVKEAIELQEKGIKPVKKTVVKKELSFPLILTNTLDENPAIQKSFDTLSPYKQKEYARYIASAKQEKTKETRLKKIVPMILKGNGLNDKYR